MARIYAGILGPLAFLASVARGLVHGGGMETVIRTAWCCLLLFAAAGYVIGWLAQWTIDDSVNGRLATELAARHAARAADSGAASNTEG